MHLLLDDRVRADHQSGFATGDERQHFGTLFFLLAAREPRYTLA
jgi:hypothetical protein